MRCATHPAPELVNGAVAVSGARSPAARLSRARSRTRRVIRPTAIRWRLAAGAIGWVAAAACWDAPTSSLAPTPVVSLTLVEGESLQVATITVTTPGDSTIPIRGVPVAAGSVSLIIQDDSGHGWPLAPTTDPSKYTAAMSPGRGASYRLQGTVLGLAIAAETRAPNEFAMISPAADTITAADTVPCAQYGAFGGRVCLSVALRGEALSRVDYVVVDHTAHTVERLYGDHERIFVSRSDRIRDFVVVAYNADAALWLSVRAGGNVTGALGGFGVGLVVRRKLYIP